MKAKMTRILILNLIIACNEVFFICNSAKDSSKATFEVFPEGQYFKANLFDKSFHQCSMEGDCNFVAENLKTSIHLKYKNEDHLPKDRKNFAIFKKRRSEMIDQEPFYVGCYEDKASRALPVNRNAYMKLYNAEGIIVQCTKECKSLGHPYAGVQYYFNCFCGTAYNKYGAVADENCNFQCRDYSGKMCGGYYKNSVYKTG
eukprot:Seg1132.1 transcript_id=Seg1132.1/GoldUCD/mRNA.D3Y31 product="Xylosyltransferase oxt" protein_id=Seg1132.1/GoldUCD/D3Y31